MSKEKLKENPTIKAVVKDIEMQWGKGAVMCLGDGPQEEVETISSEEQE